tara:strand:- start:2523 stop:2777 length:255 start_codon:yes stop_codon:yes gene_type:complete
MKRLSQEELKKLQDFQQQGNSIIYSLGELTLQKESLVEQYKLLSSEQSELGNSLSKKYGDGKIDLNTGEITLSKEEDSTSPTGS